MNSHSPAALTKAKGGVEPPFRNQRPMELQRRASAQAIVSEPSCLLSPGAFVTNRMKTPFRPEFGAREHLGSLATASLERRSERPSTPTAALRPRFILRNSRCRVNAFEEMYETTQTSRYRDHDSNS
jgi:hypothetical protein